MYCDKKNTNFYCFFSCYCYFYDNFDVFYDHASKYYKNQCLGSYALNIRIRQLKSPDIPEYSETMNPASKSQKQNS